MWKNFRKCGKTPLKWEKNPGNGTFYVKLYILWECNWGNTQHWFYVKLVYSSWATGCKKCCLERNGKTFPFSANFMFGNRQEKVIKSLVQKTWKYLVQTSCLEMGRTETWYVQVDCYFFTEDLRQFSFGRIGILKEVCGFYLTKPCQFDWRQYQQMRMREHRQTFLQHECLGAYHKTTHTGEKLTFVYIASNQID